MENINMQFTEDQALILIEARETHDQNTRKLAASEAEFVRLGLGRMTYADKRTEAERILVLYWHGRIAADGKDAAVRRLFNQAGKDAYGYPVKVEGDKVVKAPERARASCPLKALAQEITDAGKGLSDDEKAKLAERLRALLTGGAQ